MIVKRIFATIFVVSLAVSIGVGTRHFNHQRIPILSADGGRPVPPVPPNPSLMAPVSRATQTLEADGGRPVPPVPPNPSLMAPVSRATQTLEADGGRPVPPVPPGPSNLAETGAASLPSLTAV